MIERARGLPIVERAPGLGSLPFLALAARPSPVCSLAQLGEPGPDAQRVWFKRDDLVSPYYGGNKVRRWEWLLGAARAAGKSRLLSVGGTGSTQLTSLMIHGARAGFSVSGVMFDQPASAFVAEAQQLDQRAGGRCLLSGGYLRTALVTLRELSGDRGKDTLFIPPGASGAVANLAYVDAMLELGAQVDAGRLPRPDRIVVACGSGGTAVGLSLGVRLLGWTTEVSAVRITDYAVSNPLTLRALGYATARLLRRHGCREALDVGTLSMDHRFVGRGYGFTTPEAELGARRFTDLFGVAGEITYSGKALAALRQQCRENPRQTMLFWNTLSTTGRDLDV